MVTASQTFSEIYEDLHPLHKTILGIRCVAFLEIALFFLILEAIDYTLGNGDRFYGFEPHPSWIIVLLLTVQYGTLEGLVATAAATFVLFFWNMQIQYVSQSIYDYWLSIVHRPLLWCCAAVILGELRSKHTRETIALRSRLEEESDKNDTITDAYNNLKKIKEKLETQMAGELQSTIAAYRALKSIGSLNPSRTLLGMEEIVSTLLNPEKFSIYALGPNGFESATCVGWEENEPYSRRFDSSTPLYKEIAARQRTLCCINEEDAKILGNEGILAGPLIDTDTGNVFGMLKIEHVGFHKLTLNNIETFGVLCEVAGIAHSNAERYQHVEANALTDQRNRLYSFNFFQKQSALFNELAKWSELECCVITLRIENSRHFSTGEKIQIASSVKYLTETSIHDITQVFNGRKSGQEYHILLPGQSENKGHHSFKYLQNALSSTKEPLLKRCEFSLTLKTMKQNVVKAANE